MPKLDICFCIGRDLTNNRKFNITTILNAEHAEDVDQTNRKVACRNARPNQIFARIFPDEVTCAACRRTQVYKEALLDFELRCEGNWQKYRDLWYKRFENV